MINYIDLFAGAGGLSEGFTTIGCHPIAHVEMNKDACDTLKTRSCFYYLKTHGKLSLYNDYLSGKITRDELYAAVPGNMLSTVINQTMSTETMSSLYEKIDALMKTQKIKSVDLIVGGPPCQAYSLVGRARKSDSMRNDPRNYLYKIYIKMLEKYSPKMFVFENVPGLLTANKGKYFSDMRDAFKDAGYEIDFNILNAKDLECFKAATELFLLAGKGAPGRDIRLLMQYLYPTLLLIFCRICPRFRPVKPTTGICRGNIAIIFRKQEYERNQMF